MGAYPAWKELVLWLLAAALLAPAAAFWVVPSKTSDEPFWVQATRMPSMMATTPTYPFSGTMFYAETYIYEINLQHQMLLCPARFVAQPGYIELLKARGLRALVIESHTDGPVAGLGELYLESDSALLTLPFPVYEISQEAARRLKSIWATSSVNGGLLVSFLGHDQNPWKNIMTTQVPAASKVMLFSSGLIALAAVFKLFVVDSEASVHHVAPSQLILWLNLIGICLHIISVLEDPFGLQHTHSTLRPTAPFPFICGGLLLLVLHFDELVKRASQSPSTVPLESLLVPFVVLIVLMVFFEGFLSLGRHNSDSAGLTLAQGLLYCFIIAIIILLFAISVARAWKSASVLGGNKEFDFGSLMPSVCLILVLAVIMMCWAVTLILLAARRFARTPEGYIGLWLTLLFATELLAAVQVVIVSGKALSCRSFSPKFLCGSRSSSLTLPTTTSEITPLEGKKSTKRSTGHKRASSAKREVVRPPSPFNEL